ncbi:hypothetical protein SAMN05444266_101825 [Chitinophaga jiangningensis]|uniref:Uncharacterized protein n=1 Tax=Chitinophaga jiangningensis TaxID=1419482 RepID=A0A1M6WZ18_9BACT|nr:DUF6452 family protein [Chitinophaga jiangningensis]SHK98968.1 hypothetical protein SAMN05444266_101825 [Chitinophaga jiangningensis]
MKTIYQLLIAGLFLIGMAACENETKVCDQTLRADAHVEFRRDSAGFVWDSTFRAVTTLALDKDTLLNNVRTNNVYFNLDPVNDTCRFMLRIDSLVGKDTLTFRYKRTPMFISPGCGFGTTFMLDTVIATRHLIDSVIITQKSVVNSNDTHLQLFFYTE